jgi:putative Holliday junction resolvase
MYGSKTKGIGRSLWNFGVLLLLSVSSDAFFLKKLTRGSSPVFSVVDEIDAAVSGLSRDNDSLNRFIEAAALATQESSKMLGVKSVGVDYGLVRTGVAVTVGYDPEPLAIISDLNSTQVCERVMEICLAEQTNRVIVGLPLHKNGTEAVQTTITRVFASELAQHAIQHLGPNVPVYLWDERYTSKEAAARAHSKNPNSQLYGTLDADAACIILENYYDDNGKDAERVDVPAEMYDKYKQIWEERRIQEEQRLQAAQKDRDTRLLWRKEAMERDRQLELASGSSVSSSKKKKKKKQREKRGPWIVPGETTSESFQNDST